jgi:ATP-binding cassette subfamily B protein
MALGMLVVALSAGTAPDPLGIGLGLAGILLGAQAIDGAASGVAALAGASVARRVVRDLIDAARRPERIGAILPAADELPEAPSPTAPKERDDTSVLALTRVGYTYPGRPRPVLHDVELALADGDRLLLEGGSGSGKSTLAAIMAGLRLPTQGLVLLRGLDPATWGESAWRRRAVAAPQFHDNRVIAGTFAFNLLLGRGGLPEPKALAEAEAICRELGLAPLLERMPAGLMQQVGESGWQLSHGERSRLYLARALLQNADVVLLDESFGALDPANQGRALACALARARTLVVIAHP